VPSAPVSDSLPCSFAAYPYFVREDTVVLASIWCFRQLDSL
jgi:hypothetical protein